MPSAKMWGRKCQQLMCEKDNVSSSYQKFQFSIKSLKTTPSSEILKFFMRFAFLICWHYLPPTWADGIFFFARDMCKEEKCQQLMCEEVNASSLFTCEEENSCRWTVNANLVKNVNFTVGVVLRDVIEHWNLWHAGIFFLAFELLAFSSLHMSCWHFVPSHRRYINQTKI